MGRYGFYQFDETLSDDIRPVDSSHPIGNLPLFYGSLCHCKQVRSEDISSWIAFPVASSISLIPIINNRIYTYYIIILILIHNHNLNYLFSSSVVRFCPLKMRLGFKFLRKKVKKFAIILGIICWLIIGYVSPFLPLSIIFIIFIFYKSISPSTYIYPPDLSISHSLIFNN